MMMMVRLAVSCLSQFSGTLLSGLPGAAQALPPHHHPLHHDATVWHFGAAVAGRYRLPAQDAGRGEDGGEGVGLLCGAVPQCLRRLVDHQDRLVFSQSLPHH